MTVSNATVLAAVVTAFDERERAVPPGVVADRVGLDEQTGAEKLQTLADCELLARTAGGYRPTVTGR